MENKEANDFIEKMRRQALEQQTMQLLYKTTKGRIMEAIIIASGIGSVFIYRSWGINIILSLILGFITYIVVGVIIHTLIGKIFRIDKQINWLENTPDGNEFLAEKGFKKEDVDDFKKHINL